MSCVDEDEDELRLGFFYNKLFCDMILNGSVECVYSSLRLSRQLKLGVYDLFATAFTGLQLYDFS